MTRRPLLVLSFVAALAGLLVAIALALAIPSTRDAAAVAAGQGDPLAPIPPRSVAAADPADPVVAPALREPPELDLVVLRPVAPPRVEATAADPLGGPRWAVRTFTADRFSRRPNGRGLYRIGKPTLCAQLGRVLGGRFGWVDAANRWRPVAFSFIAAPIACMRRGQDPRVELTTRISDPAAGSARPLNTVVWGMAGEPARAVATIGGRRLQAAETAHGVVLAVSPASERHPEGEIELRYRDGRRKLVGVSPFAEAVRHYRRSTGRDDGGARLLADPSDPFAVDYRMPDPDGGLPWGIAVARRRDGGWCRVGMGRIVGGRVGVVDLRLGTFGDTWPEADCIRYPHPLPVPTERRPLRVMYGAGWGGGPAEPVEERMSASEDPARVARRTLEGRTVVSGVAHPDVVSVTIATPRDVRTITPSRRARLFAVIYDGDFPTGEIAVSARMRDGSVHREPPLRSWF
ncbi:hypothetical protein [Conexibacter arvalis]|uniref:Uncharacterized protein n=1 Tax=Conexibacter arvalis TaxID=912552 RepID=A0A840ICH9_9ACTN|nr:hypothetical protein [Conexibacter arvalis]MBB4661913.1 hypothetical protein [Conexibacter arvalis]